MSNARQESQGRDGGDGARMPPPAARQPAPPAASARAQARPAEDALFVRHLQQTIKSLEDQLEHAKTAGSNRQVDLGRQAEDLTQVRLERDVLRQQLATLRESSNGHHAQVARMQGELDKKNAEVADSARILGDMAQTHVAILSWESIMDRDSSWNRCIAQLTGLASAEQMGALYAMLDWNGQCDLLRYWNGKQTMQRMIKEATGTVIRESTGHADTRSFTSRNAFLATLVKLRTGLGHKIICSWMRLKTPTLSRIVTTWVAFMDKFFKEAYPIPTTEDLKGRISSEWMKAYGTSMVRFILDCTEYRTQQPLSRKAARTLYSEYKNAHTMKLLAAICPAGAYVGTSEGYPGRISDLEIFTASIFSKIIENGDCIPADKGFDQLAPYVHARGGRIVAPVRRFQGVKTYTADERQGNEEQSNLRIHVERHFSRVQNWGIFGMKKIPLSNVDMMGKAFNVISHLCNLQKSLCRSEAHMDDGSEEDEVF